MSLASILPGFNGPSIAAMMAAGGGGGGGPPDLTSISGLQLWYDWTDVASVTLDGSSKISQVNDKSGNARHATQATSGNRMSYGTDCPNGSHSATIGASKYLLTPSFATSQPLTVFAVGKLSVNDGYFYDGISGTRFAQLVAFNAPLSAGGDYLWGWCGSGDAYGDSSVVDLSRDVVTCFMANGSSSIMMVDAIQRGTTGGGGTAGISNGLVIGGNQGLSHFGGGYIAHLAAYNSILSATDRRFVLNYLMDSVGLTKYGYIDTASLASATLSTDELTATNTGTTGTTQGTKVLSAKGSNKFYCEGLVVTRNGGGNVGFGFGTNTATYANMGNDGTGGAMVFVNTSNTYVNGTFHNTLNGGGIAQGNRICIALDMDNGKIWFRYQNGNWNGSGTDNPATNTGGYTLPAGAMEPFMTFGGSSGVSGNQLQWIFNPAYWLYTAPFSFNGLTQ